eukprot:g1839.t1
MMSLSGPMDLMPRQNLGILMEGNSNYREDFGDRSTRRGSWNKTMKSNDVITMRFDSGSGELTFWKNDDPHHLTILVKNTAKQPTVDWDQQQGHLGYVPGIGHPLDDGIEVPIEAGVRFAAFGQVTTEWEVLGHPD